MHSWNRITERLPYYNKLLYTKIPPRTTKLHYKITRKIPIPDIKLSILISKTIVRCILFKAPHPRFEKNPDRTFTSLAKSRTKLYERLNTVGYIHPVGPKLVDTNSRFYRPNMKCAYYSNSIGHDTEDCINLNH